MVNGFDGRFLQVKYKENDNKYDIINVVRLMMLEKG